jgi:UDP-N-acetylmuramyl pentapeptide synthase
MGMNMAGEIARLTQIADPDIGLITNVERAHLEGLGNLNGVMKAKGELLRVMSKESTAILNGDDEAYEQLAPTFQGQILAFGLGKTNKVRAESIKKIGDRAQAFNIYINGKRIRDRAQAFNIYINGKRIPIKINLPGIHNVLNALSGAAIAFCLSISSELIAQGLGSFRPLKGRFNFIDLNGGIRIIDDTYNSNPFSLRAALQTIKGLVGKKQGLVIGLGEMMELGKESSKYHFDAGQLVADMGARYLVVLGEHGHEVIEGACQGGMDRKQTHIATTHAEMSDSIKVNIRKGDILFMKGSRKVALDKVVEALSEYFGISKG